MSENARGCFEDARRQPNDHLDSYATVEFPSGKSRYALVDIIIYGGAATRSPSARSRQTT